MDVLVGENPKLKIYETYKISKCIKQELFDWWNDYGFPSYECVSGWEQVVNQANSVLY